MGAQLVFGNRATRKARACEIAGMRKCGGAEEPGRGAAREKLRRFWGGLSFWGFRGLWGFWGSLERRGVECAASSSRAPGQGYHGNQQQRRAGPGCGPRRSPHPARAVPGPDQLPLPRTLSFAQSTPQHAASGGASFPSAAAGPEQCGGSQTPRPVLCREVLTRRGGSDTTERRNPPRAAPPRAISPASERGKCVQSY